METMHAKHKKKLEEQLKIANEALISAGYLLAVCNTDGHQVDYCTEPSIGNIIDRIQSKADSMNRIWYQVRGRAK